MELLKKAFLVYVLILSIAAFITYGIDKLKAKGNRWRIPEKTLLLMGLLGGAVGALLGMEMFRHKTRHWYFYAVNILGLLVWGFAAFKLFM